MKMGQGQCLKLVLYYNNKITTQNRGYKKLFGFC